MKDELIRKARQFAYFKGATLVGISSIKRFENVLLMMNLKGIMPSARCTVHPSDVAIEQGGEPKPRILSHTGYSTS